MTTTKTIFEKLVKEKFNGLSVAQKKVAEYFLENLEKSALSTAAQIAREVDVSETTIIRFSYALGFNSFSVMQDSIKQQIFQSNHYSTELEKNTVPVDETNMFTRVIENDIAILKKTQSQINISEIWNVVDAICKADQVLVVGYRSSFTEAYWFSYMLGMMRGNVHLCPSSGDNTEKLFDLTHQSVVLAISFPRYSKATLMVAESAKKQGATLISVTDKLLSPLGRISDITLTTDVNVDLDTGITSNASVISLLHTVMVGVKMKDQERNRARQQRMEQLFTNLDIFVE